MSIDVRERTDALSIDVFGALTVRNGGQVLAIGGRRMHLLLALLTIEVGHVVPVERLVDLIAAGSSSTPTSVHAVRMGISRLRSILGSTAILTVGTGYALDLDPAGVSSHRFCATVERAVRLREAGEAGNALHLVDRAIGMWTGAPFADLEHTAVLVAETQRLTQVLRSASGHRIELLLEAGRTGEAITGAEELMREFPLSEQPCRTAMLALARAGRSADAVRCFQAFRHRLAEETGLSPSAELQRLEREILTDADGIIVHSPDVRPRATQRHNLAHRSEDIIGRAEEVAHVGSLIERRSCVTITGTGGIGKTRLALEVAWDQVGVQPDGVWWCDLAPLARGGDASDVVAAVLGVTTRANQTVVESIAAYCRRRSMTLVLDNGEHVLESVADLVTRVVEAAPGVTILSTSREPIGVTGEQLVMLGPLSDADDDSAAVQLFERRAAEAWPSHSWSNDREAVRSICRPLAGLPLAIELAAGRVRSMTPFDMADQLGDLLALLRSGRRGVDRHRTIEATIRWSYALLDDDEQTLFRRLSVFAGGCDLAAAEAVFSDAGGLGEVAWLIERLVDQSMVSVEVVAGRARYRLLEPLRQFAAGELGHGDERRHVIDAHGRHYLHWVEAWDRRTPGDTETWATELQVELANLRTAVHRFLAADQVEAVERIICALQIAHFALPCFEVGTWSRLALEHPHGRVSERAPVLAGIVAMSGFWSDDLATFGHYLDLALSLPGRDEHTFFPAIAESVHGAIVLHDLELAMEILDRIDRTAPRHDAIVAWTRAAQHPLGATASADLTTLRRIAEATGSPLYEALFHHASGLGLLGIDSKLALSHATAGIAAARRAGTMFPLHHNVHILAASGGQLGLLTPDQLADISDSLRQQRDAGQELDQWLIISGMARYLAMNGHLELAHAIHRGLVASPWSMMHDTNVLGAFLQTRPLAGKHTPPRALGEIVDAVVDLLDRRSAGA